MAHIENTLRTLVHQLNTTEDQYEVSDYALEVYGEMMKTAMKKQFARGLPEPPRLRCSALGKPVIVQMLPILGYVPESTQRSQSKTY